MAHVTVRPRATTIILQSRLASSRLPGKALLPVAGIPSVVLSARRAANTGLDVRVATSDASADDAIAETLAAACITCFRGPHHDVLARFSLATANLPDDGVVVRLTADNLFPDGAFISSLLEEFERCGAEYLGTGSPEDGLPYGLSAEVFSVAALRAAQAHATTAHDREHVTPWIRRERSVAVYRHPGRQAHWPRLRCTLDTFDDYKVLLQVFRGESDPISISWRDLVSRLEAQSLGGSACRVPYRIRPDGSIHSLLTLGAVQLGLPYGIANSSGQPDEQVAAHILAMAADAGVTAIDTARAYGASEERIGRLLPGSAAGQVRIVTKLDPLAGLPEDLDADTVGRVVDASVFRSLQHLRRRRLDALLLHRWSHRSDWSGAIWTRLLELRCDGFVGTLGASVQNPAEAIEALADPELGHLQCPVNILDGRWRAPEFLQAVAARPDVVIHARSMLLQGLLTLPANCWPSIAGVNAQELCAMVDGLVARIGRADRLDLCMAYVLALPWVTSVVVGIESEAQLKSNLLRVQSRPLSSAEVAEVNAVVPMLPETLLNPAAWKH